MTRARRNCQAGGAGRGDKRCRSSIGSPWRRIGTHRHGALACRVLSSNSDGLDTTSACARRRRLARVQDCLARVRADHALCECDRKHRRRGMHLRSRRRSNVSHASRADEGSRISSVAFVFVPQYRRSAGSDGGVVDRVACCARLRHRLRRITRARRARGRNRVRAAALGIRS
jgi:hypothetical protein